MIRRLLIALLMAGVMLAVFWSQNETAEAQAPIVLQGNINKIKLKKGKTYILQGGVFIKKKLVAKPGTVVLGTQGSFLVIDKGAIINAVGTLEQPIVFTSIAPVGRKRRGDWGGLIFNGNAPINVPGGEADGEGSTGKYGGNNATESSGVMRFVRVEYGGFAISPENELNAIAFQGVGSGTDISFVQSAFGGDDGIEMFGGSVNMKNIVVTGAGDDTFDWTFGWNGKVQFMVGQQRNDEANNGIEADNNENDNNFTPRSAPRLMNFTLVGTGNSGAALSGRGVQLRRGTAGELRNFIITGFKDAGLELNGGVTIGLFNNNTLQIRSLIIFNNGFAPAAPTPQGANFTPPTLDALTAKGLGSLKVIESDPQLKSPFNTTAPDFRPNAGSPALVAANAEPPFANDPFFDTANFLGAFDGNTDWTVGWTNWVFGN
ncbi:MAG TPA: hypothetical protein VKA70_06160 [Blastocatellia bacterium]|nr:hypothetical protein [Blastocatellia bacterium]